jgi:VIT1/CCC1 family predicted Fe2+/Mn2+ transporter
MDSQQRSTSRPTGSTYMNADRQGLAVAIGIRAAAAVFALAALVSILLCVFALHGVVRGVVAVLSMVFAVLSVILATRARLLMRRVRRGVGASKDEPRQSRPE